jgi:hypothetical protein
MELNLGNGRQAQMGDRFQNGGNRGSFTRSGRSIEDWPQMIFVAWARQLRRRG